MGPSLTMRIQSKLMVSETTLNHARSDEAQDFFKIIHPHYLAQTLGNDLVFDNFILYCFDFGLPFWAWIFVE